MDKLFDTKRTYVAYDDEEYINMCIPVVDVSKIVGTSVLGLTKDYNGRLDRFVWKNISKNFDTIDLVMYANHIFNPFAVQEGTILNVPNDDDSLYKTSDEPELPDGTKHSKNSKGEKERTYAETIEYLAGKGLGLK